MVPTGTEYMPPLGSYPHQSASYPCAHLRHPHLSYPPAWESRGTSPYDTSIKSMHSGRWSDGAMGGQWSLYPPQDPLGCLGTPFVDQSMGSIHESINLMVLEIQQLSVQVSELTELKGQHTHALEQILTWVDMLKAASADGNGSSSKMSTGNPKGGSNNTPLLKVH
jgi:hypothetical protein